MIRLLNEIENGYGYEAGSPAGKASSEEELINCGLKSLYAITYQIFSHLQNLEIEFDFSKEIPGPLRHNGLKSGCQIKLAHF